MNQEEPHAIQPAVLSSASSSQGPRHLQLRAVPDDGFQWRRRRQPVDISTPVFFYSRRIGLNSDRHPHRCWRPCDVGNTGKIDVGALNIETADDASPDASKSTTYTVLRVKRDIFRRSAIGAMATNRSQSATTRKTAATRRTASTASSNFYGT